jgi:hypothetical protein
MIQSNPPSGGSSESTPFALVEPAIFKNPSTVGKVAQGKQCNDVFQSLHGISRDNMDKSVREKRGKWIHSRPVTGRQTSQKAESWHLNGSDQATRGDAMNP